MRPRPPEMSAQIAEILANLGPKPRRAKLRAAILELAATRPWRPVELAQLLGFSDVSKLVSRHLSPMVAQGQLERTPPKNLAHPAQSYKAASGEVVDPDDSTS